MANYIAALLKKCELLSVPIPTMRISSENMEFRGVISNTCLYVFIVVERIYCPCIVMLNNRYNLMELRPDFCEYA